MINKKIILLIIIFSILISISSVYANENTENSTNIPNNNDKQVKSITLTAEKQSTTYDSGKYFKVKAVDTNTKKALGNLKITLKAYTGKKYKSMTKTTDSSGIAKYSLSKLSIGKHKIIINVKNKKTISKTSSIKISKAKLKISAPKIISKQKKSNKFKIVIKNKESKNPMKSVKVNIKVFTGKNYKTYTLKSNKNGVVSINTKSLKKGSHKVIVNVKSTSKINHASTKSTIKIVDNSKHVKIKINGHVLDVKLENNKATKALIAKLKKGDITINAEDYGNFEKVGELGFSLPTNDKYITTKAGDIVLYEGDKICLYYNKNSWDFTRLGKVTNVDSAKLKKILGKGDVTYVMSISK